MVRTFKTRGGFRTACWALAVICTLLVVFFPFAIVMLWLAYHASVRVTDDAIVIRWFGTREHAWSDISSLARVRGGGLVGGLMAPITYGLHSKPGAAPRIAVGVHEASDELLAVIQQKTRLKLAE